jgi:hypothetical protein
MAATQIYTISMKSQMRAESLNILSLLNLIDKYSKVLIFLHLFSMINVVLMMICMFMYG